MDIIIKSTVKMTEFTTVLTANFHVFLSHKISHNFQCNNSVFSLK